MLKFFFRKRVDTTPEVKFNEQADPYLEKIVQELLNNKEKSVKITEQQKVKETK